MNKLKRLLVPTGLELLAYLSITTVALLIFRFTHVLEELFSDSVSDQLLTIIGDNIDTFTGTISELDLAAPVTLALFWGIVGIVVYIVAVMIHNAIVETREDVAVGTTFIHSSTYNPSRYWAFLLFRGLFRLCVATLLVVYIIVVAQLLGPLLVQLFDNWIGHLDKPQSWLNGVTALLGGMLTLYIFVVLVRLLLLRPRVFSRA